MRLFSKVPHLAPLSLRSGQGTEQCPPALTVIPFPVAQELPRQPFCLLCVQAVQVAGLGTFAVLQEQFHVKQKCLSIRRPFFQLDIDEAWLEDVYCPPEILPGEKAAAPLFLPHVRKDLFSLLFAKAWEKQRIVSNGQGRA